MSDFLLLPQPRHVTRTGGFLPLADQRLIVLDGPDVGALLFGAKRLKEALRANAGVAWEIVAGSAVPHGEVGATLSVVEGGTRHPQGYELTITTAGIHAVASTPAGVFYAVCTLVQLLGSGVKGQGSGGRGQTAGIEPPTSNL